MRMGTSAKKIFILLLILLAYIATVVMGTTEVTRRSLQLTSEAAGPEYVAVSIGVTGVNHVTQELTTRLGFRLAGAIASDEVTPAADLKLFVNNVHGQQEFDFPKGKRINPVEVAFPLGGNRNNYPFDRYVSVLSLLMTKPAAKGEATTLEESLGAENGGTTMGQLPIGAVAMQKTSPVPLSVALFAEVPGTNFEGSVDRKEGTELTAINLHVRRANSLILVSILVMTTMMSLAVTLLLIVLRLIGQARSTSEIGLVSMSFALIFGLPALRDAQPDVPPIGAFCDYISFIWAELIVAVAGLLYAWSWLQVTRRKAV